MGFCIVGSPKRGNGVSGPSGSSKNVESCATVEAGELDRSVNRKTPGVEELVSAVRMMKEKNIDVQHI